MGIKDMFLSFTWRLKPKGETYTFYSNLNLKTMKYKWIVLKSGYLIKVESEILITFSNYLWADDFAGELYTSDGKTLITSSNTMSYKREDAIVYT